MSILLVGITWWICGLVGSLIVQSIDLAGVVRSHKENADAIFLIPTNPKKLFLELLFASLIGGVIILGFGIYGLFGGDK